MITQCLISNYSNSQYKLCILMYSIANQKALVYLQEFVQRTSEMASRSNLHSSVNSTYIKFRTRTKFGLRFLCCWSIGLERSALPAALRTITCKDTFKRHLKTNYFNLAFFE